MNRFDVVNLLLLYIKKEEATEYTGMGNAPGWRGSALLHKGAGNQKKHGCLICCSTVLAKFTAVPSLKRNLKSRITGHINGLCFLTVKSVFFPFVQVDVRSFLKLSDTNEEMIRLKKTPGFHTYRF